eukprot:TRINITY_DN52895_c0_g2_i1.p1 TRINITY_DN52895_c0_g2~~TRINITY_DN52895_c0_g2_i1.p1  ORF type:complete len:301 (-),score=30.01 TRINITY_DN52895_c0_g2_i1:242-1144(-)
MSSGVEQIANLAGALVNTIMIVMPKLERRPPDTVTLVHSRAAEDVQRVASWLLRGPDLMILKQRTPYLAQTTEDLWKYYSSLPLDRRPDRLLALVFAIELLSLVGITRKEYPKLRFALDVYSGTVAVACLAPKQVFYRLHAYFWNSETLWAWRNIKEPQMPMPSWKEGEDLARQFVETVKASSTATGLSSSTFLGGEDRSMRPWPLWQLVLLTTGLGVGLAALVRGPEKFLQDVQTVCNATAEAVNAKDGVSGVLESIGFPRQEPLLPRQRPDPLEGQIELVPAAPQQYTITYPALPAQS